MPVRNDIVLNGMPADVRPLKQCAEPPTGCGEMKSPNGGIDLTPTKWVCAGCWRLKNSRKKT